MSHGHIPDFTDNELWIVRSTLKERYGRKVETQLADTEVMLDGVGVTWCPALFWSARGANFTIVKTAAGRYKTFFYFHPEHQLGTGIDNYDDIADCTVSVLQVESDHVRAQKIKTDESPAQDDAPDKPDTSPIFWGD
ncbi:MAG: hypothetical protein ACYDBW_10785 [Sulfuricaulis sp.]